MNPSPDDTPEPSIDELRHDWALLLETLQPFTGRPDPGVALDPEEAARARQALQAYIDKHHRRLTRGDEENARKIGAIVETFDHYLASCFAEERAAELMLHATADLAEARLNLIIPMIELYQKLRLLPESQWTEVSEDSPEKIRQFFDGMENDLPQFLASLPIEERERFRSLED